MLGPHMLLCACTCILDSAVKMRVSLMLSPRDATCTVCVQSCKDIFVLDQKGDLRGKIKLNGVRNSDWEDMSIGNCGGNVFSITGSCIWIADIGDNGRSRQDVQVIRVRCTSLHTLGSRVWLQWLWSTSAHTLQLNFPIVFCKHAATAWVYCWLVQTNETGVLPDLVLHTSFLPSTKHRKPLSSLSLEASLIQ